MKPMVNAKLSYSEGEIIIRPMVQADVSKYANHTTRTKEERKKFIKSLKESLDNIKEDDSNRIFSVLYRGEFYGVICTNALDRYGTQAGVQLFLPKNKELEELNTQIVQNFIQMCRETRLYDEKLYIFVYEGEKMMSYEIEMNNNVLKK